MEPSCDAALCIDIELDASAGTCEVIADPLQLIRRRAAIPAAASRLERRRRTTSCSPAPAPGVCGARSSGVHAKQLVDFSAGRFRPPGSPVLVRSSAPFSRVFRPGVKASAVSSDTKRLACGMG